MNELLERAAELLETSRQKLFDMRDRAKWEKATENAYWKLKPFDKDLEDDGVVNLRRRWEYE